MEKSKVVIREMKCGEQKEIAKLGRKTFSPVEGIFIGKPKNAMVADYDGKIIGGIIYKKINVGSKSVAYIEEAFVDSNYHGFGIGKKLYNETFDYLWKQGVSAITALVKDDNISSWKLLINNGFKRVSLWQIQKEIGFLGLAKHYIQTPFPVAIGMDFYIKGQDNDIQEKKNSPISFLLANILLLSPLCLQMFFSIGNQFERKFSSFLAYITLLLLFIGCRYIGALFNKEKWKFRLNNGGSFLPILLSLFGCTFLMNANWYPDRYEKTDEFKRKLALPEIFKWLVFSFLPLLSLTQILYLKMLGQLSCYYLIFMAIPIYPFESFGGGRIYRYSKKIWAITLLISIEELLLISFFAA